MVRRAWAIGNTHDRYGILLVGFPLPRNVGEPPSEIHWQPIVFSNKEVAKRSFRGKGKADEGRLWHEATEYGCFKPASPLLWTRSTNVDNARQYARGCLPANARDSLSTYVVYNGGSNGQTGWEDAGGRDTFDFVTFRHDGSRHRQ